MNRTTEDAYEGLSPRQGRHWKAIAWAVVGAMTVYVPGRIWISRASAKPWNVPETSPGGLYEIRMFSVEPFFPRLAFTSPGSGSDHVDGYIRLYDRRTGKLLESAYRTGLVRYEMFWSDDQVFSFGPEEIFWKFSEREEYPSAKR